MDNIADFPFLTADEFAKGCEHLQHLLPESVLLNSGSACLRITKRLAVNPAAKADVQEHDESDQEVIEDDHEALVLPPRNETLVTITHDVLLSPSYRVPVVYMTVRPSLPLSQVFDLVVPSQCRDVMREVGIMGALTMTDHPVTGMPAFFVHPCRTADAMRATGFCVGDVGVLDYMLIWIGIIGASVSLNVPSTALHRA